MHKYDYNQAGVLIFLEDCIFSERITVLYTVNIKVGIIMYECMYECMWHHSGMLRVLLLELDKFKKAHTLHVAMSAITT